MQVFLKIFMLLAVFVIGLNSSAKTKGAGKPRTAPKVLKEIEKKYSQTSALKAAVKKTLKLKMLEQERSFEGTLEIKKPGMFRLEFEKPEKSLAVTDGKTIWVVTYPSDPDLDNTVRVIRSRDPERVQSQALVTFLLGKGGLLNEFAFVSSETKKSITQYTLTPKKQNDDIKKLILIVNTKTKEINQISFWDALDNETSLTLDNTKFGLSIDAKNFQFSPPEGAEVTDL